MFRYQVNDLDAVERYVVDWTDQFGAALDRPGEVRFMRVSTADMQLLRVPEFTLRFVAGTSLTVNLTAEAVGGDAEVVAYGFHFQAPDHSWRFCRNDHHVAADGTEFHLHLGSGQRLPRPGPVTFDQVFETVTLDNANRQAR